MTVVLRRFGRSPSILAAIAAALVAVACAGTPEAVTEQEAGIDAEAASQERVRTAVDEESVEAAPEAAAGGRADEAAAAARESGDSASTSGRDDAAEAGVASAETGKTVETTEAAEAADERPAPHTGPAEADRAAAADTGPEPESGSVDGNIDAAETSADREGAADTAQGAASEIPENPLLSEDRPFRNAGDSAPSGAVESKGGSVAPDVVPSATGVPRAAAAPAAPESSAEAGSGAAGVPPAAGTGRMSPPGEDSVRTAAASPGASAGELRHPAVSAEAPDRSLAEPGEISILLEGQGWVFRSDLSTPGSWRFLDRERDGNATRFLFEFADTGRWNLVFERQDLSSGGSERTVRSVHVGETGTADRSEDGDTSARQGSGAGTASAAEAAAEGRVGEALEILEREADADGEEGRRARADLMEIAAASGSTAPLVAWLPKYLKDGPDAGVLERTLDVLEESAGYPAQRRLILEALVVTDDGERTPEWLYKLAYSLEKPGEGRDMDRAAALYRRVVREWPLTEWRNLSEERLAWLERHYFRVR